MGCFWLNTICFVRRISLSTGTVMWARRTTSSRITTSSPCCAVVRCKTAKRCCSTAHHQRWSKPSSNMAQTNHTQTEQHLAKVFTVLKTVSCDSVNSKVSKVDEYTQEASEDHRISDLIIPKGFCTVIVMRVWVGKRYVNKSSPNSTKFTVEGKSFTSLSCFRCKRACSL